MFGGSYSPKPPSDITKQLNSPTKDFELTLRDNSPSPSSINPWINPGTPSSPLGSALSSVRTPSRILLQIIQSPTTQSVFTNTNEILNKFLEN